MTPAECPREQAVLTAVISGSWPGACEEELRVHVQQCAMCSDVAEVAALLRTDHDTLARVVRVPAAGQVWWRAAVRARLEAAHAAARPITWLHGFAGACAAGAASAAVAFTWPSLRSLAGRVKSLAIALDPVDYELVAPVFAMVERSLPLVLVVAACVLLAPLVVLCFALADERGE